MTSDRIAVMNHGRIEQIDAPRALYDELNTRFVAGFLGRTNFIDGVCDGEKIMFDGFALPRSMLHGDVPAHGPVAFSVRPHCMTLSAVQPATRNDRAAVEAIVLERSFLGEHWDYVVQPRESALKLKVSASPFDDHPIGAGLWLELETRRMAPIS